MRTTRPRMRRAWPAWLLAAIILGGCAEPVDEADGLAPGQPPPTMMAESFLGQTPPDLTEAGQFINADLPTDLEALRGKVVLLEFSFLN